MKYNGSHNKLDILIKLTFIALSVSVLSSCTSSVRFSSEINGGSNKPKPYSTSTEIVKKEIDKSNLSKKQRRIIEEAENWIGTPYCWGGESKDCADCSGFVMEVFSSTGVKLPRTAELQYEFGKKVSLENAKPGDLIFFSKSNKITHVGIYVGNKTFIHASSSKGVMMQDLDSWGDNPKFAGCRKVL
jgi:cell wall-associated NlpC family hydrolase